MRLLAYIPRLVVCMWLPLMLHECGLAPELRTADVAGILQRRGAIAAESRVMNRKPIPELDRMLGEFSELTPADERDLRRYYRRIAKQNRTMLADERRRPGMRLIAIGALLARFGNLIGLQRFGCRLVEIGANRLFDDTERRRARRNLYAGEVLPSAKPDVENAHAK